MRIVKESTQYPVLDLQESDALATITKVIESLKNEMGNGNKSISFGNECYSKEELDKIIQLFNCLQLQLDIDFISVDKK